ncbi:polyphosphate kinase 2 [Caulobacter sp. ErkDOM-YI]|uniref:polyphosphate kinase 2 n=1 Tax=unclassified Caulobacter TaxID=2648921 RepID=UPI003AF81964
MTKIRDYDEELAHLQLALIRMQQKAIKEGSKTLTVFEGRDAAGKDGAISRITQHLSRRNTLVVALPKPSDREQGEWYFQRYVEWLPAAGEAVLFNRSWYNRGGVEPVMGFCTPQQHAQFLNDVPAFEKMLVDSGMRYAKFWLDISRETQGERLKARSEDPLKAFKISPLDAVAQEKWDDYSAARDEMLTRTHTEAAPWICVRADHKKAARLNIIRWLLHAAGDKTLVKGVAKPDPEVIFPFDVAALSDGRLAR